MLRLIVTRAQHLACFEAPLQISSKLYLSVGVSAAEVYVRMYFEAMGRCRVNVRSTQPKIAEPP